MFKTAFAAALATLIAAPALAVEVHPAVDVAGYAPYAAISQTVGSKQVVGWFETAGEACRTTLIVAEAGDEELKVAPTKIVFDVKAADVAEWTVEGEAALRVACNADADGLKVAVFDLDRAM
jgi:hypothetical protein